ncbi:MAG: sigma-54 interaction domain-containing protein [Planctomycetota bacterium]
MSESVLLLIRDPVLRTAIVQELERHDLRVTSRAVAEGWTRLLDAGGVRAVIACDDLEDADLDLLLAKVRKARPGLPVAELRLTAETLHARIGGEEVTTGRPAEVACWLREHLPSAAVTVRDAHGVFEAEVFGDDGAVETVIRGRNAQIGEILRIIDTIAATDSTVLFQGESGTGKDLFARLIHQKSRRRSAPFVAVNCGAMPETLIESELFGHEKGAFTGADSRKTGLCVAADGGTLFLDEIGEMSPDTQVKLLRVLQSGWLRPVGATRSEKVDVRVIAATNCDLRSAIKAGTFRLDLYYRLNVINIRMPALRERLDDLPQLVEAIVARLNKGDQAPVELGAAALRTLAEYSWPGNIRELENIVERLLLLHPDGNVPAADVRAQLRDMELGPQGGEAISPGAGAGESRASYPLDWTLKQVEEEHMRRVLALYDGNQTRASRALGINVKTLYNKMRSAGLKREEFQRST